MRKYIVILMVLCVMPAWAQVTAPAGNSGISNQATQPAISNAAGANNQQQALSQRGEDRIAREVRHEILLLPHYSIFDAIGYRIQGGTVVLTGQVHDSAVKEEAEKAVKGIEGVQNVQNNIELLPASSNDDRIRLQVARAIFNDPNLQIYSIQAEPPIHIIVKNGNVDLQGVVANQGDKTIIEHDVKNLPGVFNVTNDLQVESSR